MTVKPQFLFRILSSLFLCAQELESESWHQRAEHGKPCGLALSLLSSRVLSRGNFALTLQFFIDGDFPLPSVVLLRGSMGTTLSEEGRTLCAEPHGYHPHYGFSFLTVWLLIVGWSSVLLRPYGTGVSFSALRNTGGVTASLPLAGVSDFSGSPSF